jgi:hypothetical protein
VSPLHLPIPAGLAISIATGILGLIYIIAPRPDSEGAPEEEHAYLRGTLEKK